MFESTERLEFDTDWLEEYNEVFGTDYDARDLDQIGLLATVSMKLDVLLSRNVPVVL
jgi:Mg2+/Co2+ transporter CorC